MLLPRPNGLVTLLTDFGHRDPYVGLVKGMVLRESSRSQVLDLCHEVPAQHVDLGGWFALSAVGRFPTGTVHLAVVDPGVGTDRRLLAVCAHDCYWLAPDNGLLSGVMAAAEFLAHGTGDPGLEARQVDAAGLGLIAASATFHGRDLFGPLAGRLAGGRYGFRALGPRCEHPVRRPLLTAGEPRILYADGFGNLITNVPATAPLPGQTPRGTVHIGGHPVRRVATYGDGEPGEAVAVVNSYGLIEIAVVQGDARRHFAFDPKQPPALAVEP